MLRNVLIAACATATLAGFALMAAPTGSSVALAQQVDDNVIVQGMPVFKENCARCHGWDGTGAYSGEDIGVTGASLVDSKLSAADMAETISCGRPGTGMPRHSANAWTAARKCYGLVEADVPEADRPMHPLKRTISDTELRYVVAFIQSFYQGKGMTKEKCLRYNGPGKACDMIK